jgi:DNA/RNA endonuclease YhcR with UshA esterase domain
MKLFLLFASTVYFTALSAMPTWADDKKPDPAKPAAAAAAEEADEKPAVKIIDPKNVDDLKAHEQQIVTVRGKVTRTKDWDGGGKPEKGINFVDFEGNHFVTVTFASDYEKFKPSRPAALYRDKTIEVTGKLETHNGKWQIKLTSPDQVKVLDVEERKDAKEEKKAKDGK